MSLGLTPKQRQTLDWICAYQTQNRCSPSYDEIAEGVGLKAKSGVHRLVTALEDRGHLHRNKFMPRSLTVPEQHALDVAKEHVHWAIHHGQGLRKALGAILGAEPGHTSLNDAIAAVAKAYEDLHS